MERFNQLQFGCLIAKFYLPTKGDTSNSEHSHHIEMAMTMQELEDFIRAKEKDVRHHHSQGAFLSNSHAAEFKKRVQADIRE